MNYINKKYSNKPTPTVSKGWINLSEKERLSIIVDSVDKIEHVAFTRAMSNGYVYLVIEKNMNPGDRGELMMELEVLLKKEIDDGLTIWHEPIGDKNSLRKLRGIKVKTS